jgi:hypothetical protein
LPLLKLYHRGIDDDALHVRLSDGREVTVPLTWFPRLLEASPEATRNWRWIGGGVGTHWPELKRRLP